MKLKDQVTDLQRRLAEQARKLSRLERERGTLLQHLASAHQEIEQLRSAASS